MKKQTNDNFLTQLADNVPVLVSMFCICFKISIKKI